MQSRLWTPDETAAVLGVAVGTLSQWRATRRVVLPFVKVGRCVRYRPQDVLAFVECSRRDHEEPGDLAAGVR